MHNTMTPEQQEKLVFIEKLMVLMKDHIINEIEVDGVKITKSRHLVPEKDDATKQTETAASILFASTPGGKPPKDFDMQILLQDPFKEMTK